MNGKRKKVKKRKKWFEGEKCNYKYNRLVQEKGNIFVIEFVNYFLMWYY